MKKRFSVEQITALRQQAAQGVAVGDLRHQDAGFRGVMGLEKLPRLLKLTACQAHRRVSSNRWAIVSQRARQHVRQF